MCLLSLFTATTIYICLIGRSSAELRWCKVSNASLSPAGDGWMHYDDAMQSCINCSMASVTLVEIESLQNYECCEGNLILSGTCSQGSIGSDTSTCSNAIQCDGVKQCENGIDEINCNLCDGNSFTCPIPENLPDNYTKDLCISLQKVCDARKDCPTGLDEINCMWHEGWCSGFLCGVPHARCLPKDQVCDGVKQCVDGSDEINCLHCDNQFQCLRFERNSSNAVSSTIKTAHCIGTFRICDGIRDCDNGIDEMNCYRWREWTSWSDCHPPTTCSRTRTRSCIDGQSREVDPTLCYDVDDYHENPGLPSVERENKMCRACIPPLPPSSVPTLLFDPRFDPGISDNSEVVVWDNKTSQGIQSNTIMSKSTENTVKKHIEKTEDLFTVDIDSVSVTTTTSHLPLVFIILGTAGGIAVLVLLSCLLVCCCSERRSRRGKWKPTWRFYSNSSNKPLPSSFRDIEASDSSHNLSNIQDPSNLLNQMTPETITGLGNDSGIDEANSTLSHSTPMSTSVRRVSS